MTRKPNGFQCEYCGKLYKLEPRFMAHECEQMKRSKIIRSTTGIVAYDYYMKWLKTKGRGANVNIETFGDSKYFNQFVSFVKWVKRTKLHDVEGYLRFMKLKEFPPHMWRSHEVFAQYLEFVDKRWGADDHAKQTIKFLIKFGGRIAEEFREEVQTVDMPSYALRMITITEMATFITNRKLSPWVLLNSTIFRRKFVGASSDQKLAIEHAIDLTYWKAKMKNNPDDNDYIKDVVTEFNL